MESNAPDAAIGDDDDDDDDDDDEDGVEDGVEGQAGGKRDEKGDANDDAGRVRSTNNCEDADDTDESEANSFKPRQL